MMVVQWGRARRRPKQGVRDPVCVPWRQQGGSSRAPLRLWLAAVGFPIIPDNPDGESCWWIRRGGSQNRKLSAGT